MTEYAACPNLCKQCSKPLPYHKKRYKFCDQSCSAIYNNVHKTTGIRRSKLEVWIAEQIRADFPSLRVLENDRSIGLEIDIFLPDLRLGIEINGIVHYEPIYGDQKFSVIVDKDRQKIIRCYELGIELAVINSSKLQIFTEKAASKYYSPIKSIIEIAMMRLG